MTTISREKVYLLGRYIYMTTEDGRLEASDRCMSSEEYLTPVPTIIFSAFSVGRLARATL